MARSVARQLRVVPRALPDPRRDAGAHPSPHAEPPLGPGDHRHRRTGQARDRKRRRGPPAAAPRRRRPRDRPDRMVPDVTRRSRLDRSSPRPLPRARHPVACDGGPRAQEQDDARDPSGPRGRGHPRRGRVPRGAPRRSRSRRPARVAADPASSRGLGGAGQDPLRRTLPARLRRSRAAPWMDRRARTLPHRRRCRTGLAPAGGHRPSRRRDRPRRRRHRPSPRLPRRVPRPAGRRPEPHARRAVPPCARHDGRLEGGRRDASRQGAVDPPRPVPLPRSGRELVPARGTAVPRRVPGVPRGTGRRRRRRRARHGHRLERGRRVPLHRPPGQGARMGRGRVAIARQGHVPVASHRLRRSVRPGSLRALRAPARRRAPSGPRFGHRHIGPFATAARAPSLPRVAHRVRCHHPSPPCPGRHRRMVGTGPPPPQHALGPVRHHRRPPGGRRAGRDTRPRSRPRLRRRRHRDRPARSALRGRVARRLARPRRRRAAPDPRRDGGGRDRRDGTSATRRDRATPVGGPSRRGAPPRRVGHRTRDPGIVSAPFRMDRDRSPPPTTEPVAPARHRVPP